MQSYADKKFIKQKNRRRAGLIKILRGSINAFVFAEDIGHIHF